MRKLTNSPERIQWLLLFVAAQHSTDTRILQVPDLPDEKLLIVQIK